MTSNKAKEINKKDKLEGKRFGKLKVLSVHKKHTKISSEKSTTVDFSLLFFIW